MPWPRIKDISEVGSEMEGTTWMEQRIAYDANDNAEYVGLAKPGTGAAAADWYIRKYTWAAGTVSGFNNTRIQVASDEVKFDKVWNDRATYF